MMLVVMVMVKMAMTKSPYNSPHSLVHFLCLFCCCSVRQALCMVLDAACVGGGHLLSQHLDTLLSGLHGMVGLGSDCFRSCDLPRSFGLGQKNFFFHLF